jgi:hypothetical protein
MVTDSVAARHKPETQTQKACCVLNATTRQDSSKMDDADSENEDSTSYNISFPDISSSKDEFQETSPSQYQHETTKVMPDQLV